MLNASSLDKATVENTLTVLLKHEADIQRARRALSSGRLTGSGEEGKDKPGRMYRGLN